jgi:hypothetical protein
VGGLVVSADEMPRFARFIFLRLLKQSGRVFQALKYRDRLFHKAKQTGA